jgi:predicted Zn-dependent protease
VVSDSASGNGTGHATRSGRPAPRAEHLVLVGGGAAGLGELLAPIAEGLLVPALERDEDGTLRLHGAFAIEGGRRGAPVADAAVELSALDVLATTQALTMAQRTVAAGGPSARTTGATVCPALRATAGLRVS